MEQFSSHYPSKTFCKHSSPFAYATLTEFERGKGLLQIHSDWGSYSFYWGGMGQSLPAFLADASPGYIENKLSTTMHSMGFKKEAFAKLTKFMAQCWPDLKELFKEEAAKEASTHG